MAKSLKNMMGAGIGAGTATLINGTVADALVATGSAQADALVLTNDVNVVGFVSAGTGVRLLANPQPGDEVLISNLGANALAIYPPIGGTISGASVDSPFTLPAGAASEFVARKGSANWVVLSSGAGIPALGTLSLSATTFTRGASTSGTILGATTLSTITASGLPSGLTIDGTAHTWSWDGSGSGASSGSITLTETLAGYSNTPHDTIIGYTIIAAATLTAPTLTVFNGSIYTSSATGVSGAPVFQMTIPSDVGEGDYVEEQIDTVNTFDSGGLLDEERVLQWDGSAFQLADETTFAPGNFSIDTGLTSSTTFSVRRRFRRTYGDTSIYSAWSSTVTVTTAAVSSAVLTTATGTGKSANITVSGSPALTFTGANGNGSTSVRSTIQQANNKAQFELTVVSGATTTFGVGIDDGTTNLNAIVAPGITNSAGWAAEFNGGTDISINWNASANQVFAANGVAGTTQNGDIFTIVHDITAGSVEVWRTRSGTTVQIGSTVTGLPTLSAHYAFGATINSTMSGTLNFGASTYAKTPGTGVASYWA